MVGEATMSDVQRLLVDALAEAARTVEDCRLFDTRQHLCDQPWFRLAGHYGLGYLLAGSVVAVEQAADCARDEESQYALDAIHEAMRMLAYASVVLHAQAEGR